LRVFIEKLKLQGGAENYNYLKQGECSRSDATFFKDVMVRGKVFFKSFSLWSRNRIIWLF